MNKVYSIFAAAALLLTPAVAHAETTAPVTFKYAGETFTYTVETVGSQRIIRGETKSGMDSFVLTVGESQVSGTMNGSKVSFPLRSVRPVAGIVVVDQLASR